jgi:hypothetical protein
MRMGHFFRRHGISRLFRMRLAEATGRVSFGLRFHRGVMHHSRFGGFGGQRQFLGSHIGFFTGRTGCTGPAAATTAAATAASGTGAGTARRRRQI